MGIITQEANEKYEKLVAGKNFRSKDQIISGYNESIKAYERFRRAVAEGKYNEAAEELSTAASKLAATVEWSEKYVVFHKYNQMLKSCTNDSQKEEWERICRFEELVEIHGVMRPKHMSTSKILRIIKREFSNEIQDADLVFNYMDNEQTRAALINGYKHNGTQPDASAFVQTMSELYRFIVALILKAEEKNQLKSITDNYPDSWEELFLSCGYFKPNPNRRYILLTDCIKEIDKVSNLFRINWDMVLDLSYSDAETLREDMFEQYISLPDRKKVIVKYLCDFKSNDSLPVSSQTYWIKVNGKVNPLKDSEKILDDKMLASRYVGRHFFDLLKEFVREYDMNVDLVVLGCSDFFHTTNRILQVFSDVIEESDCLTVHFLSTDNNEVKNFVLSGMCSLPVGACKFYKLTDEEFYRELAVDIGEYNQVTEECIMLPSTAAARGNIDFDTYEAMRSVMDVIYLGIEKSLDPNTKKARGEAFLKGNANADWDIVLDDKYVIAQEKESDIRNSIIHALEGGTRTVCKVEYEAGLGGTTFMRRLGFQLHNDYPTVIVSRYLENVLVDYLFEIYSCSLKKLVILVDSNEVSANEVSRFQNELCKNYQFSFVIMYMVRKEFGNQGNHHLRRMNYLQCKSMQENLLPYIESNICKANLADCVERARVTPMEEEAIPFVLSMYAFEESFAGIEPYIKHSLDPVSEQEKSVAFMLALSDFANYKVSGQYFRGAYGMHYLRQMKSDCFALAPLIKIVLDDSGKKEAFKLKYPLFGRHILAYFSNGSNISFAKLADRIVDMIVKSRRDEYAEADEETVKLLHKLFIEREDGETDNDTNIRGVYSPLVTQLVEENRRNNVNVYDNSENVVVNIFQTLVNVYPDEPHFAGHLARFYFYTMKNYSKGFEIITEAIKNAKIKGKYSMGSLYHIKAMGYSARIQTQHYQTIIDAMDHAKKTKSIEEDYENICGCLDEIKTDLVLATDLFDEARKEGNSRFASNVAECKLTLRILYYFDLIRNWCIEQGVADIIKNDEQTTLYDKIDSLVEDCEYILTGGKGEQNNFNEQHLKEIKSDKQLLKAKEQETEEVYRELIRTGTQDVIKRARRRLARIAYESVKDDLDHEESQIKLREIVAMMEENFEVDASNNSNFRIWFKALRALRPDDAYADLEGIFNKLDRWTSLENASPDAFYYKYIVKFIQAYEEGTLDSSSKVQNDLKEMLNDLTLVSNDIMKKTIPFEWFSEYGKGLRRLITNQELSQMDRNNAIKTLHLFRGSLPSKECFTGRRAFISFGQQLVHFNPQSISNRIGAIDENQYVTFAIGFSYDGLRSYHDSINVLKRGAVFGEQVLLEHGKRVTVKVLGSNSTYLKTEILNSGGVKCDIRISDMEVLGISSEVWSKKWSTFEVVLDDTITLGDELIWRIDVHRTAKKNDETDGYRPFANIADILKTVDNRDE